jgi:hypothetical protein
MNDTPEKAETLDPIAALKAAELKILLAPVFAYLTALQQPGANVQTAIAGLNSLELQELAQAPLFEAVGINNVAAALETQITTWASSVTASSAGGASA